MVGMGGVPPKLVLSAPSVTDGAEFLYRLAATPMNGGNVFLVADAGCHCPPD